MSDIARGESEGEGSPPPPFSAWEEIFIKHQKSLTRTHSRATGVKVKNGDVIASFFLNCNWKKNIKEAKDNASFCNFAVGLDEIAKLTPLLLFCRAHWQASRDGGPQHLQHLPLPELAAARARHHPRGLPRLQADLQAQGRGRGEGGGRGAGGSKGHGEKERERK